MQTKDITNNEQDRVLVLLSEIDKLKKRHQKHYEKTHKEVSIREEELKKICTHKETIIINETDPGSYYDRTRYHKITKCKFCGKKLNDEITIGSYE